MLVLDLVGDAKGHDSPSLSSLSAVALPVVLLQLQSRLPCPPAPPLRAAVQEVLSSLLLQDGAAEQGNAPVPELLGGSVQEVLLLEDRACLPCKVCAGLSAGAGAAGSRGGTRRCRKMLEQAGGCISPAPIPPAQGQATHCW